MESLIDSEEFNIPNYLRGRVPLKAYTSAADTARWLGLGLPKILDAWMAGPFKRFFDVVHEKTKYPKG